MPALHPPDARSATALPAHLPTLDGVRAIAIVGVLLYHATLGLRAEGAAGSALLTLAGAGWMGVDLFFVLSGFLITGILLETKGSDGYYRTFAVRRALRILPVYYAALLLLLLGSLLLRGALAAEGAALREAQGWYWLHAANLLVARHGFTPLMHTGHFWSLAVEEQFYLAWPLVVALCSVDRLRRACVALIVGALAVRIALVWHAGESFVESAYVLPIARLDALALGAWLAVVARAPGGLEAAWPRVRALGLLGVALLAAHWALTGTLQWGPWPMQTLGYTAAALASVAVVAAAARATGWLRTVLASGPLRYVGRRSYALYVVHFPLIWIASHAGLSRRAAGRFVGSEPAGAVLWTLLLVAASVLLAEASWRAIERPCLALKDRLAPRPSGSAPLPAPVRAPDDALPVAAPRPVRTPAR